MSSGHVFQLLQGGNSVTHAEIFSSFIMAVSCNTDFYNQFIMFLGGECEEISLFERRKKNRGKHIGLFFK